MESHAHYEDEKTNSALLQSGGTTRNHYSIRGFIVGLLTYSELSFSGVVELRVSLSGTIFFVTYTYQELEPNSSILRKVAARQRGC